MTLPWGNQIIEMMAEPSRESPKVAIIRHSERPAFDNLPYDQWDLAELTERGIAQAMKFGEAIGSRSKSKELQTFGWGLRRCQLTAEAICRGYLKRGRNSRMSRDRSSLDFDEIAYRKQK
jgi:broad specificity phosphatase PhoE